MVEHRKGLNRALFWLYSGHGRWPSIFRWSMLVFDLVTIAVFLVHPLVSWHDGVQTATGIRLWVDILIAAVITLDFLARFYIERHKWRFFTRWSNIADLVVVATLLLPIFLQNLVFLRVLRVVRLLRAFEYLHREHGMSTWLHRNGFVIAKVVNLAVFIFLVTALVFVTQVTHNPDIKNYLDALYFTVGTLTTVGLGDITLPDTMGRVITIGIMVLGVTLFLQLIRAIAIGDKMRRPCPDCRLQMHDRDAAHCKRCGADLFEQAEDSEALPRG